MAKKIVIPIEMTVNGKKVITELKTDADALAKSIDTVRERAKGLSTALQNTVNAGMAFQQLQSGLMDVCNSLSLLTSAAASAQQANTKLRTVMEERMDASDEEIESINKTIKAQTELGVIGGVVQKAGAQQIATFLNEASSLETLIPAMNNLIAQKRGLNATEEDAVAIGNLFGKAMQGQTTALRRVGITFDETQAAMLKYGDESQKAAMLAEVVRNNVGEMNAELAKTDAGRAKQLSMAIGSVKVKIGEAFTSLLPFMQAVTQISFFTFSVGKLAAGFKSLATVISLSSSKIIAAISVKQLYKRAVIGLTAVLRAARVGFNSAAIGATTFKMALRSLLISTGIGAAIVALTFAVDALVGAFSDGSDKIDETADSLDNVANTAKRSQDAFNQSYSDTFTNLMSSFTKMKTEWQSLGESAKAAWIRENKDALYELGIEVDNVATAEKVFNGNTDAVVEAFKARARAAALLAQLTEEYRIQAELIDKQTQRDNAAQDRHTVKAGDNALGYVAQNGYNEKRDKGYIELGRDGVYHYTEAGAARQNGSVKWMANNYEDKQRRKAIEASKNRTAKLESDIAKVNKKGASVITGRTATKTTPKATPKATPKGGKELSLIANPTSYKQLANNVSYYQQKLEASNLSDKETIKNFAALKQAAEQAQKAFNDMVEEATTPVNPKNLEEYEKRISYLEKKLKAADKTQFPFLEQEIEKLKTKKDELENISIASKSAKELRTLSEFDKKLTYLKNLRERANKEQLDAIDKEIKETTRLKEELDDVPISILSVDDLKTADLLSAKADYITRQLKTATGEERKQLLQQAKRIQDKQERQDLSDRTATTITDPAQIRNIRQADEAISLLQEHQSHANAEEVLSLQRQIDLIEKRRTALQLGQQLPDMQRELESITSLKGHELRLRIKAEGFDGLTEKIKEINRLLENPNLTDAQRKQLRALADEYGQLRKKAVLSLSTVREGWDGVKGIGNSVKSITEAIENNGDAWQQVTGTVDGFLSLYDSVQSIIGIISQLITALFGQSAAEEATAQTSAAAAAETAADAKLEAAAMAESAAAKIYDAHALIPFIGPGLASGFVSQMLTAIKAAGAVTAFADGGIVSGPTYALVGEYAGAKNNPEVIAPLDRLQSMLEPRPVSLSGHGVRFEIEGRKLIGVIQNEQRISSRSGRRGL